MQTWWALHSANAKQVGDSSIDEAHITSRASLQQH
jgi:hypothetical protein